MRLITVYVSEAHLKGLDELVRLEMYPNRSEAIRLAIHDLLELHRAPIKGDVHDQQAKTV